MLNNLDRREWLLTNGLGSFASGTVTDIRTRSYHGWLFAALKPPEERFLLLSHLEASLELPDHTIALGTNYWGTGEIKPTGCQLLRSFDINPVPTWEWGNGDWRLSRRLVMPHTSPQLLHRLLIEYCYQGVKPVILRLRLLVADRNFHDQQIQAPDLKFSQMLGVQQVCLQADKNGMGTPWHLRWTRGEYQEDAVWYWNYSLLEETARGLGDKEDLYSPGYLSVAMQPGDRVTLEARVGFPESYQDSLNEETFAQAVEDERKRLLEIGNNILIKTSDQFIAYRQSTNSPTVIAGYHWFDDGARDALIALPGLLLVSKRYQLAKEILSTFGKYCRYGLIANQLPGSNSEAFYSNVDIALWWIETLGLYLEATQDWEFLVLQYPIVQKIYKAYIGGTRYNIHVDSIDGLISWDNQGVALTWMDALVNGRPVTPRRGKPVEVNALWYSALCWASRWAEILSEFPSVEIAEQGRFAKQSRRYAMQAEAVKFSLQKFWNSNLGYLYDTIEPDDRRNSQIRPNAVLALSFAHCGFTQLQGQQILELASVRLLTPYGLRSLDPLDPNYVGKYAGNQQQRDYAYHQGTVWCWLIGAFIRAWQRFYPETSPPFSFSSLLEHFMSSSCMGSISEIFDGDEPHTPRGAIAQAKSVAEIMRCLF
ncbi:MAG: glycogen debranching enzyme family protein [Calothrix sp. C42_A2020_038]|nr:glycogen debranching enzyme family protein [Calothrix sp. C42_A2020_038]